MDSRPVFVLLTASDCPACHNFKRKVWPSLKKELERENRVQIVIIEVPTTRNKPDPIKYHKELSRFIGWFPTMSLYPAERWYDRSSDLIGIIKNGKIVPPRHDENGNFKPEHVELIGKINLSENDIIKWVNYTLDKPDGMFVRLRKNKNNYNNYNNNIMITNNGKPIERFPDGKFKVPTSGYYAKFEPSKVE